MKKILKVVILLALAIAWMVVIFELSSMNAVESGSRSRAIISKFIEDAVDTTTRYGYTDYTPSEERIEQVSLFLHIPLRKLAHATVYLILAIFVFALTTIFYNHNHYFKSLLVALVICILFAISDEFHQSFVPGRDSEIMDVVIDSCGAAVGIILSSIHYLTYELGYRAAKRGG